MLTSKYGASRASTPPSPWISSVAFCSATSRTSSTVIIPTSTPRESVTGSATRSYFSNVATTSSRVAVAGMLTSCWSFSSETFCSGLARTRIGSRRSSSRTLLSSVT